MTETDSEKPVTRGGVGDGGGPGHLSQVAVCRRDHFLSQFISSAVLAPNCSGVLTRQKGRAAVRASGLNATFGSLGFVLR